MKNCNQLRNQLKTSSVTPALSAVAETPAAAPSAVAETPAAASPALVISEKVEKENVKAKLAQIGEKLLVAVELNGYSEDIRNVVERGVS